MNNNLSKATTTKQQLIYFIYISSSTQYYRNYSYWYFQLRSITIWNLIVEL